MERFNMNGLQMQRLEELPLDPFNLARTFFLTEGKDDQGRVTLRLWRGEWYRYQGRPLR